MQLKDAKGWAKAKAANTDPYGGRVISYAEDWANFMERDMAAGRALEDIAGPTSHEADTDGITGYMYGAAVATLAAVWIHGEALRRWHNLKTQIGTEGERANETGGTLNPAILNIGTYDSIAGSTPESSPTPAPAPFVGGGGEGGGAGASASWNSPSSSDSTASSDSGRSGGDSGGSSDSGSD